MKRDDRTYRSYDHMKQRCLNPNNHAYPRYGGRGIKICERWLESYANFHEDMGTRPPNTSLERKDSNKDYSPDNCVWGNDLVQNNNKDSTNWATFYYDNQKGYSDDELKDYEQIDDLCEILDGLKKKYPHSSISGGIKLLDNRNGIATFAILKKLGKIHIKPGETFHKLTPIEPVSLDSKNQVRWKWLCSCGGYTIARQHDVFSGNTKSCGCLHLERITKHGLTRDGKKKTRIYKVWEYTRAKCENPNTSTYSGFGGKGVTVCDRWKKLEHFVEDMGIPEAKKYTLVLKDGAKVFNKENCFWRIKQ